MLTFGKNLTKPPKHITEDTILTALHRQKVIERKRMIEDESQEDSYSRPIDLTFRPSKESIMTVWGKVGNYAKQVLP